MGRMISDLLEYSRIQSRGALFGRVDLNQVLRDVLSNLAGALKESSSKVTIATLPYVTGDAIQLVQLFQNLIQNAIKYRQENESPIIHVGLIPQPNGMVHLFIRDNCIGIDPKFFEKLFVLFHRLHPRDKYPGTGVGLASCKKIVERHGGQNWVESEAGKDQPFILHSPDLTIKEKLMHLDEEIRLIPSSKAWKVCIGRDRHHWCSRIAHIVNFFFNPGYIAYPPG